MRLDITGKDGLDEKRAAGSLGAIENVGKVGDGDDDVNAADGKCGEGENGE